MRFAPSQIFFPFSVTDAVVAGRPALVGLGTRIMAPSTPIGKLTESLTVSGPVIAQEEDNYHPALHCASHVRPPSIHRTPSKRPEISFNTETSLHAAYQGSPYHIQLSTERRAIAQK